jgi:hypothetical protein
MNLNGLERRIETLETRRPPVKSDTQRFLEKLADDELDRAFKDLYKRKIENLEF